MMNDSLGFSERRSVATIVGTFFFLVVMIGGFAALVAAFELNSDLLESQFKISEQETQKVQEAFTIQAAYDSSSNNLLCVTIDNTGAVPLEVIDLWISDKTAAARTVDLVPINYKDSFVPMGSTKNILESTTKELTAERTYDIKAVTTSGIMKTTELLVSNASPDPRLDVTAFTFPKNAASGQELVVGMFVRNAGTTTLLDVKPATSRNPVLGLGNPTVVPTTSVATGPLKGFTLTTATSIASLRPDETVVFMWDPEITGGVGSTITFTLEAEGKVLGCDGSSVINSATDSEAVEVVPGVRREIFARPELLISFPNPFGQSTATGYWAIVAANPTDQSVDIQQVSIQILNAESDTIMKAAGGGTGGVTQVKPTADWTLTKNQLYWQNFATPISVGSFEAKEFIARTTPSNQASNAPINTAVFSVYSSFGQFNVVPFTFGYSNDNTAIVNVFMNSTAATGGLAQFVKSAITTSTTVTFDITISNTSSSGVINDDSSLLINVPPGWTAITNTATGTRVGLTVQTHKTFADGSTQIPVELDSAMGLETRSFQFQAQAPSVSTTALYILTLTAQGTATGTPAVIVGPLSEAVLQVCPKTPAGARDCNL